MHIWKLRGIAQAVIVGLGASFGTLVAAHEPQHPMQHPRSYTSPVPDVEAKFSPKTLRLGGSGDDGLVSVELRATRGSLAVCTVSDLMIGTAPAVSVLPYGGEIVAKFKRNDLAFLPEGEGGTVVTTGRLTCNGVQGALVANASVNVIKETAISARVKPILTVQGRRFKDLNGNGKLDLYEDWRAPVERRVEDLLGKMTLQEKAGLMQITSYNAANNTDYIQNRHIRFLILRARPAVVDLATQLNATQQIAEGSRLGIPSVITSNPINNLGGGDAVFEPGGGVGGFSVWPGTLGLAATGNLDLIRSYAAITRTEWRNAGIRRMYGYQVELATEPRWTRNRTTFTEGVQYGADIARTLVEGYQGKRVGQDSVALAVKHFPGDGSVRNGLDPHNESGQYAVYPTRGSLFKHQIVPFQAAIDAGVSSVMPYYNVPNNALSAVQLPFDWWLSSTQQFEEVGSAYSSQLLTKLLRERMGFKGVINTDSGILDSRAWGVANLSLPQRFTKAVRAGVSIISDNNNPQGLIDAVNLGMLKEGELNDPVRRLLTEMFSLGLFEDPYVDPARAQATANSSSAQLAASEAHRQSLVLMRNNLGLLPLGTHAPVRLYIQVMGPGAAPQAQTESLKAFFANDPAVTVVNSLAEANAALVWLTPAAQELADSINIDLGPGTGIDVAAVQQIEATVPTILAVNFSNAWVINAVEPKAAAVIGTFDVKAEALVDLVRGRFQPSGRLPVSIPASQAAVAANASDVPGYLEAFPFSYKNAVGDTYTFGFGRSRF